MANKNNNQIVNNSVNNDDLFEEFREIKCFINGKPVYENDEELTDEQKVVALCCEIADIALRYGIYRLHPLVHLLVVGVDREIEVVEGLLLDELSHCRCLDSALDDKRAQAFAHLRTVVDISAVTAVGAGIMHVGVVLGVAELYESYSSFEIDILPTFLY